MVEELNEQLTDLVLMHLTPDQRAASEEARQEATVRRSEAPTRRDRSRAKADGCGDG
jgi:hypothetical protein